MSQYVHYRHPQDHLQTPILYPRFYSGLLYFEATKIVICGDRPEQRREVRDPDERVEHQRRRAVRHLVLVYQVKRQYGSHSVETEALKRI